jgi:protein-S-isoprenylcysteine O-methyltransferase Ste14
VTRVALLAAGDGKWLAVGHAEYTVAARPMRRLFAILGSLVFLFIAPGFVAGVVPWWITRWRFEPPIIAFPAGRIFGAFLILGGIPLVLDSFARFALQGLGTPAPMVPTRHLVASGFYRYVRNPMYIGVVAVVLGQALLFGNLPLVSYGFLLWGAFHLFVIWYEEPTLRKSFDSEYQEFSRNVPRWIPRLKPWRAE